jgi:RNA polymerase sigma-70 factor (ECF subfamily)
VRINSLTLEDGVLVERLAADDRDAFEACYYKYHAPLYRFALKLLKSSMLAEEVVHDTFLKIWENRLRLDATQSLRSYLFTITRNDVLNLLARSAREAAIAQEILASFGDAVHNNTENEVVYNDYQRIVQQAIDQLPPQRRQVFTLCRLEGRSYEEVATLLNISTGTVSDHMVKAGKSLRQFLNIHTDLSLPTVSWVVATILFQS